MADDRWILTLFVGRRFPKKPPASGVLDPEYPDYPASPQATCIFSFMKHHTKFAFISDQKDMSQYLNDNGFETMESLLEELASKQSKLSVAKNVRDQTRLQDDVDRLKALSVAAISKLSIPHLTVYYTL